MSNSRNTYKIKTLRKNATRQIQKHIEEAVCFAVERSFLDSRDCFDSHEVITDAEYLKEFIKKNYELLHIEEHASKDYDGTYCVVFFKNDLEVVVAYLAAPFHNIPEEPEGDDDEDCGDNYLEELSANSCITDNARVLDDEEEDNMATVVFPNLNKNASLALNDESIQKYGGYTRNVKIERSTVVSNKRYNELSESLLIDDYIPEWTGIGGDVMEKDIPWWISEDSDLLNQYWARHCYSCVAEIINRETGEIFYVDTETMNELQSYARSVGRPVKYYLPER